MSLFKKFQLKPTNQTKESFKYIIFTSVDTVKLNVQSLNFTKTSNFRLFYNKRINFDFQLKFQEIINFKKIFHINTYSIKNIKFIRTSNIVDGFSHQKFISKLNNKGIQFLNVINSPTSFDKLNRKINFKSKQLLNFFLAIYKNILFKCQNYKLINRKNFASLSAMGGLFTWEEYKISDNDIKHEVNEMMNLFDPCPDKDNTRDKNKNQHIVKIDFDTARSIENDEWKLIYDKKDLMIWRRSIILENDDDFQDDEDKLKEKKPNYDLFEYKVLGRFNDITPLEFYQTQIDLEYRKEWDYLAVSLDIISKDPSTSTELIQWIMKFPYPLNPREYVYIRRYCIDPEAKILILVSKSVPKVKIDPNLIDLTESPDPLESDSHNKVIENFLENQKNSNYVRVTKYESNIIVFPHFGFDKPGLYYVIQYYDINKAKIPKIAYKWMATSGLPDYLDKVHKAALKLKKKNKTEHVNEEKLLLNYEKINLNENFEVEESEILSSEILESDNSSGDEIEELGIDSITNENEELGDVLTKKESNFKPNFLTEQVLKDFFCQNEPHPVFYN